MVKSFMAREGFTRMDWGPTVGLFKLRFSELWLSAHLEPRSFCTVTSKSLSQSGWSGSFSSILTHGCCQRGGKVGLVDELRVSMLAISVISYYR